MGKRVRRLSVFLLVAVAALSVQVGLLCRVCKASEPSEEVVARIKKFFSIIDDDGKEFLFPEDAANLDLSDITVGNGYKRYRLEGERLEDSNLVNYPIFSGGRPFAICITKYNDSGVEEVVQAGSIRSEPYYGEDIDYSDVTHLGPVHLALRGWGPRVKGGDGQGRARGQQGGGAGPAGLAGGRDTPRHAHRAPPRVCQSLLL